MNFKLVGLSACFALAATLGTAQAQSDYPTKPVKLIVNYPAGGGSDAIGRAIAKALEAELGQPVPVENIAGGSATRGVTAVVTAPPDGYTLGIATNSPLTFAAHSVEGLPWGHPDTYDIIGGVGSLYNVLAVQPDAPYSTVAEVVSYAKEHPGELRVATVGGGLNQYVWDSFTKAAGIETTLVPYSGDADGLAAFLGGNTELVELTWSGTQPHIEAGKAKPVALFAPERLKTHPDIPTFKEEGFDITTTSDYVVYAPKDIPSEIRAKIAAAVETVIEDPELKKSLESRGIVVGYESGESLKPKFIKMYEDIGAAKK